ncbi:mitochondrial genome maintenance protein [Moelleriella libera RCEF 2490]|uniref:Mitochondrial genome maintenance protein MGM101 n=1 Tax=Moelleriella libera RCEF 2490 TaxID=1081109 RepID=A0A168F398_9HYPO|nr:mitochondrial genome maintenance protein [Moelleriella libera RCEF 2490]
MLPSRRAAAAAATPAKRCLYLLPRAAAAAAAIHSRLPYSTASPIKQPTTATTTTTHATKPFPAPAAATNSRPKPATFTATRSTSISTSTSANASPAAHDDAKATSPPALEVASSTFPSSSSSPSHAAVLDIDWSTSFHGIASKPVSPEQYQTLMAPLDIKDIEVKPDGVIYLPEIKYRRRLNEAFRPMGWGMIPKGDPVVGSTIVTREYALIVDGRFVAQAQGENPYFTQDQLPSSVEGCKSNALMRCCKDLGIGSELWDPHFIKSFKKTHMEEVWVEHTTTKKKRTFWYRKGHVDVAYPYKLAK